MSSWHNNVLNNVLYHNMIHINRWSKAMDSLLTHTVYVDCNDVTLLHKELGRITSLYHQGRKQVRIRHFEKKRTGGRERLWECGTLNVYTGWGRRLRGGRVRWSVTENVTTIIPRSSPEIALPKLCNKASRNGAVIETDLLNIIIGSNLNFSLKP